MSINELNNTTIPVEHEVEPQEEFINNDEVAEVVPTNDDDDQPIDEEDDEEEQNMDVGDNISIEQ